MPLEGRFVSSTPALVPTTCSAVAGARSTAVGADGGCGNLVEEGTARRRLQQSSKHARLGFLGGCRQPGPSTNQTKYTGTACMSAASSSAPAEERSLCLCVGALVPTQWLHCSIEKRTQVGRRRRAVGGGTVVERNLAAVRERGWRESNSFRGRSRRRSLQHLQSPHRQTPEEKLVRAGRPWRPTRSGGRPRSPRS